MVPVKYLVNASCPLTASPEECSVSDPIFVAQCWNREQHRRIPFHQCLWNSIFTTVCCLPQGCSGQRSSPSYIPRRQCSCGSSLNYKNSQAATVHFNRSAPWGKKYKKIQCMLEGDPAEHSELSMAEQCQGRAKLEVWHHGTCPVAQGELKRCRPRKELLFCLTRQSSFLPSHFWLCQSCPSLRNRNNPVRIEFMHWSEETIP